MYVTPFIMLLAITCCNGSFGQSATDSESETSLEISDPDPSSHAHIDLLLTDVPLDALQSQSELDPIKVCGEFLFAGYETSTIPKKEVNTVSQSTPLDIVLVLDKSGSISPIYNDILGSTNAFITEQQRLLLATNGESINPGIEPRLSLLQFSSDLVWVREGVPLGSIKSLSTSDFVIGGSTALYDAIGDAIHRYRYHRDVVLAIVTDGEENQSQHFTLRQIRPLLECYSKRVGWQVVYLSASEDGFQAGADMGVRVEDNYKSEYENLGTLFHSVSEKTGNYSIQISRAIASRATVSLVDAVAEIEEEEREL